MIVLQGDRGLSRDTGGGVAFVVAAPRLAFSFLHILRRTRFENLIGKKIGPTDSIEFRKIQYNSVQF
jgi:hypothetical protein